MLSKGNLKGMFCSMVITYERKISELKVYIILPRKIFVAAYHLDLNFIVIQHSSLISLDVSYYRRLTKVSAKNEKCSVI